MPNPPARRRAPRAAPAAAQGPLDQPPSSRPLRPTTGLEINSAYEQGLRHGARCRTLDSRPCGPFARDCGQPQGCGTRLSDRHTIAAKMTGPGHIALQPKPWGNRSRHRSRKPTPPRRPRRPAKADRQTSNQASMPSAFTRARRRRRERLRERWRERLQTRRPHFSPRRDQPISCGRGASHHNRWEAAARQFSPAGSFFPTAALYCIRRPRPA